MINRVTKNDTANGPGIRVTVWFQGCPHHCNGCHNPETWNPDKGKELTSDLVNKIFEEVDKPWVAGLSISGGDPLASYNLKEVVWLAGAFREHFGDTKTIWLWTGYSYYGCYSDPDRRKILKYLDVIVDNEYNEDLKDPRLKYAGSSNQRVIDVKQTLKKGFTLWQDEYSNAVRTMTPHRLLSQLGQPNTQLGMIFSRLKKLLSRLFGGTSSD